MMIPFNKTNFTPIALIKSLICVGSEKKLKQFFRRYTGKKFVLVTNSCRSALYLTYKCLDNKGQVITSPLTCKVAVDPLIAAGFEPLFTDIEKDSLNMSVNATERLNDKNVRGIQLIHLGGIPCESEKFKTLADTHGYFLVEDCAQALFGKRNNTPAGTVGDYVCFSLIKNAKGIGGGILATNDEALYLKAKKIQESFPKPPFTIIFFRIIRNILENYRYLRWVNSVYHKLMNSRPKSSKKDDREVLPVELKLYQPASLEKRIAWVQIQKAEKLWETRKNNGFQFLNKLHEKKLAVNYQLLQNVQPSFVKFYIHNKSLKSLETIEKMHLQGVEAMHLEHKYGVFYQQRFDKSMPSFQQEIEKNCPNYLEVHDHLATLPFYEELTAEQMDMIIDSLQKTLDK